MHDWVEVEEPPPPGWRVIDQYRNLRDRSRLRAYATVAAIVLVVVGLGAVLWQRGEYGVWPGSDAAPNEVEYCGRSFHPVGPAEVQDPATLHHAFTFSPPLAPHHEVYADKPIATNPDLVCSMHLLMHMSGSRYASYVLEGGP